MSKLIPSRRAITWDKVYGSPMPRTFSGKNVDERNALKYSAVWACVTLIADAISNLEPKAYTEDSKGRHAPAELPPWVRKPHPVVRRGDIWSQLLISMLLWGNGYASLIRRPSDLQVIGLDVVDPSRVHAEWAPTEDRVIRYQVDSGNWLDSTQIFHVRGPSLPGDPTGLSVIAQAREAVALGLTLEEFGARYFAQGSMARVILTVPGDIKEDRARDMVNIYEKFHRGPSNWHRPAVASNGATVTNVSIPPNDAQFLESREFQAIDVARWYRVPPHRISIISKQSSWGSGLAEENTAMTQHTFRPWIIRMESAFTAYTPGGEDRGLRIRLNDAVLLRGSFKEQVDAWGAAYDKGVASRNEAREGIGLSAVSGGDEFKQAPAPTNNVDQQNQQDQPASTSDGQGSTNGQNQSSN